MVTDQGAQIERRQLPAGPIAYQQFHGTIPSIESVTASVRSWVVTMGFRPTGPMAVEIQGAPAADLSEEYDVEVQLPVEDRQAFATTSRTSTSSRATESGMPEGSCALAARAASSDSNTTIDSPVLPSRVQ